MKRLEPLEKTRMLRKIEGKRKRGKEEDPVPVKEAMAFTLKDLNKTLNNRMF